MDSKLLRNTIVTVILGIAVVFAVVLYLNGALKRPGGEKTVTTQTAQEEEAPPEVGTLIDMSQTQTGYGTQIGSDLTAFERDAGFFNDDATMLDELYDNASNRLSLMVTSVARDIRVYVVDLYGEPVRGQSFVVTLSGQDEYKDVDQDGMIYIADLSPGEYEVALTDTGDYLAPLQKSTIKVRDQLEYQPLYDISYMICNEDEINAAIEDTRESQAAKDGDEGEEVNLNDAEASWGIDVSKYQKDIDWKQVADAGVQFAIIRCGYRGASTGCLVEDPYFRKNIEGAKAAGIKVGVYFFTQAVNETEAVEEASTVLTLCKDYELDYPAFIDTEGAGGNGRADNLDKLTRTKVVDTFCTTLENSGLRAGIYSGNWWFHNNLMTEGLGHHYIWLAEWRKVPQYEGKYDLWQYTSKGSVAGIEGNVDLDISYIN